MLSRILATFVLVALICSSVATASASTYSAAVLALSPTAYYRLDEVSGTVATDISGNGHTGTYVNTAQISYGLASLITGDPNKSMAFTYTSGTSQGYLHMPNTGWPVAAGAYTLVAWINVNPTLNHVFPMFQWGCSGLVLGFNTGVNTQYTISSAADCSPPPNTYTRTGAPPTGILMVAMTCCSASKGVWIYSPATSYQYAQAAPAPATYNTGGSFAGVFFASSSLQYDCSLSGSNTCGEDEVAVFNYALTSTQMASLYSAGSGTGGGSSVDPLFMGSPLVFRRFGSEDRDAGVRVVPRVGLAALFGN